MHDEFEASSGNERQSNRRAFHLPMLLHWRAALAVLVRTQRNGPPLAAESQPTDKDLREKEQK